MWKNILLTIIISLWLIFIGYALSCFVAYIIEWPPFVAPIVFTVLSFIAIIIGIFIKTQNLSSTYFVLFCALFFSSATNWIILGNKFSTSDSYHGSVLDSNGYLYNKWGYRISEIRGIIIYKANEIYLMTENHVYAYDYYGNYLDDEDFILKNEHGSVIIAKHPFTKKYHIKVGCSVSRDDYDNYAYMGKTEAHECFKCKNDGLWDLVMVDKRHEGADVEYSRAQTIKSFGNPIRCFVVKDGTEYIILNENGDNEYSTEHGIYNAHYNDKDKRLQYEDENGKRWYHQF